MKCRTHRNDRLQFLLPFFDRTNGPSFVQRVGDPNQEILAQFAFCMQTRVPLINIHRIKQMRQNQEVFATDHNQFQDRLSGIDGLSPE